MSYRGGSHGDGARGGGGYSRGQSSGNSRGGRGSGAPRGGSGAPRGGSGAPRGGSGGGFARCGGSGHGRGGGSDYARGGQGRGRGFSSGDRGGRGAMRDIVDPNLISRDNINFSFNPSKIGSVKPEFVARKGHLAKELPNCRQIKLMTNHFAFGYTKDYNIYHYDFSWFYHGSDPDNPLPTGVEKKLGRADCYLLFDAVLQQHSHYFKGPYSVGYDGSRNVYSPYLLKCAGKDKRLGVKYIELEGLKGVFSVAFKLANTIELKSLRDYQDGRTSDFQREVIQALEVILKFPSRSEMVSLGRYAMFPVNQDRLLLSSWMELALGHRKSLRLSEIGLTLVVDRAATAFRKSGKAEDFLKYVISPNGPDFDLSRFRPNAAQMEVIRRAFLCLKVETSHLGFSRVYKVKDITDNSSDHEFFVWNEEGHNGEISVAEYFATKYRINLKYPNLPCLRAGKSAMIPIEICDIVANQHPSSLLTRLSPDEQAEMIRMTATPPDARFTCLLQAHGQIRQKISDTLDQFGLNIDIKPIGVTGVVLGPPKLIFHQNREVLPVNGKWDLRGNNFYKNKAFKKFGVINFCANPRDLDNFCEMFIKKAVEMKMMSGPSDPLTVDLGWLSRSKLEERKEGITAALRQMKASNCAFALCFFPPDKSIYNLTKRIADTSLLFPTQGVAPRNVKKISEQLMANILSKVNKKLGGINVILNQSDKPDLLKKKIMIIGADVTHPGEADELYSSVAASVSTYDKDHTMFYPSVRVQPKKTTGVSVTETIVDFRSMVQEHLDNFKATNNFLPDVILYLRDGVSEGQYASILTQEVNHLIRPYGTDGKYKPSVTAVIVSKRIQTRTRPVNPGDAVGKAGNVPPGTTIDSIITHPSDFDYFQYGHEGIQGTSRPCHYYLVHDDNNLNCAEMSKISFHLCHLFERCTRSTSAPAPIMHAHNLAYRARQWIVGSGEKKNLRGMTKEQRLQAETKLANQLNDRVKNIDINFRRQSMFFV